MLSSGGVPDSSSEGRSAHSWHQLANSIYFHGISLCQNIHEQGNEDPRHRQAAATRAREGAREGRRTARRAPGTVTATRRLFSRAGPSAGGRGRAGQGIRRVGAPGIAAQLLATARRLCERSEGRKAVTLLIEGVGGWGAGARRKRGRRDPAGHLPPGWVGSDVSWTPAPKQSGLNVPGESPAVPGKGECSGVAPRVCPRAPEAGRHRAPGAPLLRAAVPRRCSRSLSEPCSPRRYQRPRQACGPVGVGLPWTLGEGDVKELPGLGSAFRGAGSWGAAGQTEDAARWWRGLRARGHADEGPKSAPHGDAWPWLRPRLPQGRRGLPLAADGRGLAVSPTRGCAPGRGTGEQGFREARAPAGPVAVRASRRTPARAQPWEENVVVTRVAATCRTSPTPRISCLRADTPREGSELHAGCLGFARCGCRGVRAGVRRLVGGRIG